MNTGQSNASSETLSIPVKSAPETVPIPTPPFGSLETEASVPTMATGQNPEGSIFAQGSMHIPINGNQRTDVKGYETVMVDGELEGRIDDVVWFSLARDARFTGSADVAYADLSGEVDGDVHCHQKLIVRSTARIRGKFSACTVEIHPGALISGTVESYGRKPQSAKSPPVQRDEPVADKSPKPKSRFSLGFLVLLIAVASSSPRMSSVDLFEICSPASSSRGTPELSIICWEKNHETIKFEAT